MNQTIRRKTIKPRLNVGIIILLMCIFIFSIRVISILKDNKERGGFAFVQLLNFSMPIVETEIYDEGAYAENNLSVKRVCLEALGLDKINNFSIVNNEVSLYKQGFTMDNSIESLDVNPLQISSFNIDDDSIIKVENNTIDTKTSAAYDASLKKTLDQSNVEVLIYHTHTTENYAEANGDTLDENASVVGVGSEISRILEEDYGIAVIHDKTNHSISYNNSYKRSNETVSSYLNKYGDFKMIIDLHRDSVDNKEAVTGNVNGEDLAKLMFVTTKNSTRYDKNQALADEFFNRANELFPGLTRKIYTYNRGMNAFNQSLSDGCMLIECGANTNTMNEAKTSAKYIARLVAEHINR